MSEHAAPGWPPGETPWRQRAEQLAEQLEILRTAHVSLVRRHRELREEAAAFRAATARPQYVVESARGEVFYRGASRAAALTAAKNAYWSRPRSSVVVYNGEVVVWSARP